jgi:hypothetical protein
MPTLSDFTLDFQALFLGKYLKFDRIRREALAADWDSKDRLGEKLVKPFVLRQYIAWMILDWMEGQSACFTPPGPS